MRIFHGSGMSTVGDALRFESVAFLALAIPAILFFAGCGLKSPGFAGPEIRYADPDFDRAGQSVDVAVESGGFGGKSEDAMTAGEHEKIGDAFLARRKLHMAYVQYEKSLRKDPDCARVCFKLGMTFLYGKKHKEAGEYFEAAVRKAPDHAKAHEGLGKVCMQSGRYKEAEEYYLKATALNPGLWQARNDLGLIYDARQEHEKAVSQFEAAISLEPRRGFLHNNLGFSLFMAGRYEESLDAYRKALKNGYETEKVHNNIGLALAAMREYDQALEAFRKGSGEAKAYNNLGTVFLSAGRCEEAAICFKKAIEASPGFYSEAQDRLAKARACSNGETSFFRYRPADEPFYVVFGKQRRDAPEVFRSEIDPFDGGFKAERPVATRFPKSDRRLESTKPAGAETRIETSDDNLAFPERDSTIEIVFPERNGSAGVSHAKKRENAGIVDRKTGAALRGAKIEIYNGNGVDGFAGRLGRRLKAKGFQVERFANAEHFGHDETKIFFGESSRAEAWLLAREIFGIDAVSETKMIPHEKDVIRIVAGRDIVGPDDASAERVPVEISNGNGVDGMAGKVAAFLKARGFVVDLLTNADHFNYENTRIFYPKGRRENAVAISARIPVDREIELVETAKGANVRVLIGKDLLACRAVLDSRPFGVMARNDRASQPDLSARR